MVAKSPSSSIVYFTQIVQRGICSATDYTELINCELPSPVEYWVGVDEKLDEWIMSQTVSIINTLAHRPLRTCIIV